MNRALLGSDHSTDKRRRRKWIGQLHHALIDRSGQVGGSAKQCQPVIPEPLDDECRNEQNPTGEDDGM